MLTLETALGNKRTFVLLIATLMNHIAKYIIKKICGREIDTREYKIFYLTLTLRIRYR